MRSGFDAGIDVAAKLARLGIWLRNISSTVAFWRICFPVMGEVPSFKSVARISAVAGYQYLLEWQTYDKATYDSTLAV